MKNKCAGAAGCSSPSSSSSSSCIINHPKKKQRPTTTTATAGGRRSKKTAKIINKDDDAPPPANAKHPRRSSIYRGVTRHRWTGRYEAHLWDKTTWNNIQNKRGRQIYLGAYDNEEAAAHTYDLAALKYWGSQTTLNFPIETYTKEMEEMDKLSKEEYLASLRRRSSGFSRGVSKYRGVARHHHNGRWEARIGRVHGNKYLYLGTYSTQEEAAVAYDLAAIEYRGPNAVTNFDISRYADRLKHTHNNPDGPAATAAVVVVDTANDTEQMLGKTTDTIIKYEQQTRKEEEEAEELALAIENELEELPQCINNNNTTMDHQHEHGEEEQHPWSLCLDMGGGFNPLPVSHVTNGEMELLDLFDDATFGGFWDDIDFMFDVPMENEGEEDQLMRPTQGGDVNGPPQPQSNHHACSITTSASPSSSLSSSSNSTTTSVSCIYSSS